MLYRFELTDTFGGEANYSWVKRGFVVAETDQQALRKAKKELDMSGLKGRSEYDGVGDVRFEPRGSCTVLFVNFVAGSDVLLRYDWEKNIVEASLAGIIFAVFEGLDQLELDNRAIQSWAFRTLDSQMIEAILANEHTIIKCPIEPGTLKLSRSHESEVVK